MAVIRVVIADDHAVVREGVKRILSETGDIQVTGEAADAGELLSRIAETPCDVLVLDLSMPGTAGLDALKTVRAQHPTLPVVVLSIHAEDQYGGHALAAGAAGYVQKSSPPDVLVEAIRAVAGGGRFLTPALAAFLATPGSHVTPSLPHEKLSRRECQVLRMIASGKSVTDIATELSLSVKTVSTFRRRLLAKLRLHHNAEVTRYAMQHGLVD